MEIEKFFSGYCRQLDAARTVEVIAEDGEITVKVPDFLREWMIATHIVASDAQKVTPCIFRQSPDRRCRTV